MSLLKSFFSGKVDETLKWETVTSHYAYDATGPLSISGSKSRSSTVQYLSDNKFIHFYRAINSADMYAQIITVNSPSSVSFGTPTVMGSCENVQPWFLMSGQNIAVIDSTKFAVVYKDSAGKISLRIGTISGTTITDNGESLLGGASNCSSPSIVWNGTWLIVSYLDDSNDDYTIETWSVSGTTTTWSGQRIDAPGGYRFNGTMAFVPGSTTELILGKGRSDNTGAGELTHVTINNSNGAISLGAMVEMATELKLTNPNILVFSNTTGIAFYKNQDSGYGTGRRFTLSGTAISVSGTRTDLPDNTASGAFENNNAFFYDIDNKKFVLGTSWYYFAYQYNWDTENYTNKNTMVLNWGRTLDYGANAAFGGGYMVLSGVTISGSNYYNTIIVI